ncbi:MAG TPA: hypothetical protein PL150_11075, partial [Dermatophilaceae bacterium]|nr:hypothetical protein [Dermatophilaceae bacterium]
EGYAGWPRFPHTRRWSGRGVCRLAPNSSHPPVVWAGRGSDVPKVLTLAGDLGEGYAGWPRIPHTRR